MHFDTFERTDTDSEVWVSRLRKNLTAQGISVIECADLIQQEPQFVVLPPEGFEAFCRTAGLQAVFLYRGAYDITDLIRSTLAEDCDWAMDQDALCTEFLMANQAIVNAAQTACPTHFYAELFVLYQGAFIATGCMAAPFEVLVEALNAFCIKASDRHQGMEQHELERVDEELDRLEEMLINDPQFAAIRGRRKRCLYVEEKYGSRIPHSGSLNRVDRNSDPVDVNLARLVERASDRLELRKS